MASGSSHRYLRRSSKPGTIAEPIWPHLPITESSFVPYSLSEKDALLHLLTLCADLKRPPFRAALYRALILVLYCTGIPFWRGLYACECETWMTRSAVLFVDTFKGRVPMGPVPSFAIPVSAGSISQRSPGLYARGSDRDARLFVGVEPTAGCRLETASRTFRILFKPLAGLKPERGSNRTTPL